MLVLSTKAIYIAWGILRLWFHFWFSKAWFNAWCTIVSTVQLNKWKNNELFKSPHGEPELQASCFFHKYVSSPDTRSFILPQGLKLFYIFGNLTTSHESPRIMGLTLVFTFWLSHWEHFYSQNQDLMGMWLSFESGGTYYFLTHIFSFLTRMWMTSWKGMCDRPEMVHLCCENKNPRHSWWPVRIKQCSGLKKWGVGLP